MPNREHKTVEILVLVYLTFVKTSTNFNVYD